MSLKLINSDLMYLVSGRVDQNGKRREAWLNVPLHGAESRARNRVFNILGENAQEVEKKRMEIVKRLAEQDSSGKLTTDENGNAQFSEENKVEFAKCFVELMSEDLVVAVDKKNVEDVRTVKNVLARMTEDLNAQDGAVYDRIMSAFEEASA